MFNEVDVMPPAEERFEVSGDEMERHLSLSLGEPEQLRRNMTPASEGLYVGNGTPGSFGGDEQMEAPPDDLLPPLDFAARPAPMQACLHVRTVSHSAALHTAICLPGDQHAGKRLCAH